MSAGWIVFIVICVILVALIVTFYILGKRAQKKQEEQQSQIEAAAQNVSLLIIDKKRMKLKDANLPSVILEQTPKLLRGSKLPVVKAKAGPRIMTFICEESIFDMVPVKKEVKATVSGIYITKVKGLHGNTTVQPTKKLSWWKRMKAKASAKTAGK